MTARRITRAGLERISERLGPRDFEILETLSRLRVASTRQLERLHFITGTPLANARSCRASLHRLTEWSVLTRLDRRVGGVRAGSASFVYALGLAGQRIAGVGGPARGGRYLRPWTPSWPFLKHQLAISELYVGLQETARSRQFTVETFETEPVCWRYYSGATGEPLILKPDAFVRVAGRTFMDHYFVEVDLATESTTVIRRKLDRYRSYWNSGQEQHRHGVFPRVLWLVPDAARLAVVVGEASRQPAEAWRLFQVTKLSEAPSILCGVDHA